MPSRSCLSASFPVHHPHLRILSSQSKPSSRKSLVVPITAVVSVVLVLFALSCFFFFCIYRRFKKNQKGKKAGAEDDEPFRIHKFKYWQLKRATKCFAQDRKLGKGGFGVVYKGLLNDGKEVAVKKLDRLSLQGEREFQNELLMCSGLDSPYVVSLLGYCTHGKTVRLLVYECMQNRSLQEALFERGYPAHLDWRKRFKIIVDTAKALEFLHVGCNPPIIHGDIKPSNILLDRNFSARVADFGLARFKNENVGSDSARYSISSEKLRPDTPERFRFGTPDLVACGTPEMSRSSTTRNPLSDCPVRVVEPEHVKDAKNLTKEASFALDILPANRTCEHTTRIPLSDCPVRIVEPEHVKDAKNLTKEASFALDILPANRACELDDASNNEVFPCSPAHRQLTGQVESVVDEAEALMFPVEDKVTCKELGKNAPLDKQKNAHRRASNLSIESSEAIVQDNLSVEAKLPPLHRPLSSKKGSDNGMLEVQDESSQLAGKAYVLDWLGSELPGNDRDSHSCKQNESIAMDQKCSRASGKKSRLGGEQEADIAEGKKDRRKARYAGKKGREWWKDEYFAELSGKAEANVAPRKKNNRNKKVENLKDYLSADLSSFSGELLADLRSMKYAGRSSSKEWVRNGRSGELGFCGRIERKRVPSIVSDTCSEDRKCHFSAELVNGQWSGELTKSGELVSKDVSSTTSMRGTVCYVAPEYGGNGILSEKSDIYSFGVLMLVILSGRRPIQVTAAPMREFERANLISWARSLSQCGKLLDLMDVGLNGEYDCEEAVLCITLALLCLQRVTTTRPHISEIVKILSREMAVPNLPLELSPSPPARIPYKLPTRSSPQEHHPSTATP